AESVRDRVHSACTAGSAEHPRLCGSDLRRLGLCGPDFPQRRCGFARSAISSVEEGHMKSRTPRVALVSIGIGRVQRGFEKYFTDLFHVLRDEIDITLWRSGRPERAGERVPPVLATATRLAQSLPIGQARSSYQRDCIAYGLMMLPGIIGGDYDVIH